MLCPLLQNDIHIWILSRNSPGSETLSNAGTESLSSDELRRYRSFANPDVARRFLLGRTLLRCGLAAHLPMEAKDFRFAYGPNGKPELDNDLGFRIAFSLSHTRMCTAMAVTRAEGLGLDLEPLSRAPSILRISNRFFSDLELHHLESLDESQRDREATALWCLKESAVKAVGSTVWDGLSGVSLEIDQRQIRWNSPPPEGHEAQWFLMMGRFEIRTTFAVSLKSSEPLSAPPNVLLHTLDKAPVAVECDSIASTIGPVRVHSVPD